MIFKKQMTKMQAKKQNKKQTTTTKLEKKQQLKKCRSKSCVPTHLSPGLLASTVSGVERACDGLVLDEASLEFQDLLSLIFR